MYDKQWTLALEILLDVLAITWAAFKPGDQSAYLLIVVLFLFALDGVYLASNSWTYLAASPTGTSKVEQSERTQ
jgi:hypothetical protein